MAELINLRRARKEKARQQKADQADKNRQFYGRSKEEKRKDAAKSARNEKAQITSLARLDAHKLDKKQD